MPLTYPPTIAHAHFPAPPQLQIVNQCPNGPHQCSLVSLELAGHPAPAHSFTNAHPDLGPTAAGRYRFAPGVDTLTVRWGFSGEAFIVSALLELFRPADAQPLWTKALRWDGARSAQGTTDLDGQLGPGVNATASNTNDVQIAYLALGTGLFPADLLTAEHAPYRLKMSITSVEPNTNVIVESRWLYLDVVVKIELFLGPQAWIPPAASAAYEDTRLHAHRIDTWTWLNQDLLPAGGSFSGANALQAVRVMLRHNVFAKSARDFYDNAVFCGSRKLWNLDPVVPVKAEMRVERANGVPAALAAGAPALGGLQILWDWTAADQAPHPNSTARAFITEARAYKLNDWPHALVNCHYDHGGKRGAGNPDPYFEAAAALPNPADALAAAANRPWSTFSAPVTDSTDPDAGLAGVLFLPSRIAGDTYKLRAVLAYPNRAAVDLATNAALRAIAPGTVVAESPTTLTVWRRVNVARHLRKNNTVSLGALTWPGVAAYFEPLCVDVVGPPHGTEEVTQLQYTNAFGNVRNHLPLLMDEALDADAAQHNGGFALNLNPFATFRTNVRQTLANRRIILAGHYADDGALRLAQYNRYITAGQWYNEDLSIPTRAAMALPTDDELADATLASIDITDEDSYKKNVAGWGSEVLAKVAGALVRIVAPNDPGIHFFHFDFENGWNQQSAVGYAHTIMPAPTNCASCNALLPPRQTRRWWTAEGSRLNRICAACSFRVDDQAVVAMHAPLRYMNGQIDPWGEQNLSFNDRVKIRAGGMFGTTADIAVAHEIGHTLGMPHAGPAAVPILMSTGGVYDGFHDQADKACLMSYNFREAPQLHFCGVCVLRISGWSSGPSDMNQQPREAAVDRHTVQLLNVGQDNRTLPPPPGATWQPDSSAAGCHQCNAPFTITNRRRHCRACGQLFCGDHCSRTALVRRPLSSQAAVMARVCNDCQLAGLNTPRDNAYWRPDDSSSSCVACYRGFSKSLSRHHCRLCGYLFCDACTPNRVQVIRPLAPGGPEAVTVCDGCYPLYA